MIGSSNEDKAYALVSLYRFPLRRQIYALEATLETLNGSPGQEDLRRLVEEALAFANETLSLRDGLVLRNEARKLHQDGAMLIDYDLSRALSGLATRLQLEVRALEPEHPRALQAIKTLKSLFPEGVAAVSRLPFVEQAIEVRHIVSRLQSELKDEVELFGLKPLIDRVRRLNHAHATILGPKDRPEVTRKQIAERVRQGNTKLRYIAAYIFVRFGRPGVDDDEVCERLLGPILAQNEDLKAQFKRRRAGQRDRRAENRAELARPAEGGETARETPVDKPAEPGGLL